MKVRAGGFVLSSKFPLPQYEQFAGFTWHPRNRSNPRALVYGKDSQDCCDRKAVSTMASTKIHHTALPSFDDMPPVKGMPHGCAWGLFDVDGGRNQLGTLNLLTPDVVLAAKDEINEGVSIALNWPMHNCTHAGFGRKTLDHKYAIAQYPPLSLDGVGTLWIRRPKHFE